MPNAPQNLQPPWLDPHRPREGRYVLGPVLGKGGMGVVLEAWDVVLCRTVALKVLQHMEPTALIQFMHEARIQARMAHPHICRIYDMESSEGTVKIAMQLIRGPNLEQAAPNLSLEALVTILAQVTEAVHAAHGMKLIHRDLKPSNIILERGGNDRWVPYLCDFGLALALDEPGMADARGPIGTPAYMAPEQFSGNPGLVGPATDVFALGGTLHFALLGHPPPPAELGRPLPGQVPPRLARPGRSNRSPLPPELWTIIRRCLEFDPALRYPSAALLAQDLWRFLNGEPIQVAAAPARNRPWRGYRQVLGAALLATAGATLIAYLESCSIHRSLARDIELNRSFELEVQDLEKAILIERLLPIHDLRPGYGQALTRISHIRNRMATLGKAAEGPGHAALARAYLALGDARQAAMEASQAMHAGRQDSGVVRLLTLALGQLALDPGTLTPAQRTPPADAPGLDPLLQQSSQSNSPPSGFIRGLPEFLRKDFAGAIQAVQPDLELRPWDPDGCYLESICHTALANQAFAAGDGMSAEAEFRRALASAQRLLSTCPGEERLQHARFLAARWLGSILLDRRALPPEFLQDFQQQCTQALALNPDHPGLQEDWLGFQGLRAMAQRAENRDPSQELSAGLLFLGTRLHESLSPGLAAARRLIYWQVAEASLDQGQDPRPALAEAMKDLGDPPFLHRDVQAELLLVQARSEGLQGHDPRPVLSSLQARLQPHLEGPSCWQPCQWAAEGWLIQGQWELAHGHPCEGSLRQAVTLAERALRANPRSGTAFALNGLALAAQMDHSPGQRSMLSVVARDRLKEALALHPKPRLHGAVTAVLAGLARQGSR